MTCEDMKNLLDAAAAKVAELEQEKFRLQETAAKLEGENQDLHELLHDVSSALAEAYKPESTRKRLCTAIADSLDMIETILLAPYGEKEEDQESVSSSPHK